MNQDNTAVDSSESTDDNATETDWIVYEDWQVGVSDIDRALRGSEVHISVPGSDQKLVLAVEEVTEDDHF